MMHEERVLTEEEALADNLFILRRFINLDPMFKSLSVYEQAYLKVSYEGYLSIYFRTLTWRNI